MKKTFGRSILAAIVALGFLGQAAVAQIAPGVQQSAQTATIAGTVSTSDGTLVAGADVKLIGPALLSTTTDAHGAFQFTQVPHGVYTIVASAGNLGTTSKSNVVVNSDINVQVQYSQQSTQLKTIASVTTKAAGAHINVTPASIASVNPSDAAFRGNVNWREMLNVVPGVTISSNTYGGGDTNEIIPDSPFQPITVSINGALGYETSTTMDGMPMSNFDFSASPGGGVNLGELPMPLFDTADVVRGPGANAPSIVDSVGGSFVLHAPGNIEKNSFELSFSNDPYGGFFSNEKATFKLGKLSVTEVYGFNNSPGPRGKHNFFGPVSYVATINGTPVTNDFTNYVGNPVYGNCYCIYQTPLVGLGNPQEESWAEHNGGLSLTYQVSPSITAQAFYAANQSTALQPDFNGTVIFSPDSGYTGPLAPGNYIGQFVENQDGNELQSTSLLEQKVTAYIGRGVLRLAGLENYSWYHQALSAMPPTPLQLWGSVSYCNDPNCLTTTPAEFTGQTAIVAGSPFNYETTGVGTNDDILASYEMQLGSNSYAGLSAVRSSLTGSYAYQESYPYNGVYLSFGGGVPPDVKQTDFEYRLHAGTQIGSRFNVDASYYFTNAKYHVQDPNGSGSTYVDSLFHYSAPRVGFTWRASKDEVFRLAAGGGYALPPLLDLVGFDGPPSCSITVCYQYLTNINLQPETSFAWDAGTDLRINGNTAISLDVYRTDLFGQLFQSTHLNGVDPRFNIPIYAQEYLNLGHSRYEGINVSVQHDVPRGVYWHAGVGFTRGYIVSVPPGFYDFPPGTCDFSSGANCQNTYAVTGDNFISGSYGTGPTSVPYANGNAAYGYRWSPKTYLDIQMNYLGKNNGYYVPAFAEFDAHGGLAITKNFALVAKFQNVLNIYGSSYQFLTVNPNLLERSVAGQLFPLDPIPYGPRSVIVTADFSI